MTSLSALLSQEEDIARKSAPGPWEFSDRGWQLRLTADEPHFERIATVEQPTDPQYWAIQHAADHDPVRVLREASAKRQILARHERLSSGPMCSWCSGDGAERWPCADVISIGAVYGLAPHEIEP